MSAPSPAELRALQRDAHDPAWITARGRGRSVRYRARCRCGWTVAVPSHTRAVLAYASHIGRVRRVAAEGARDGARVPQTGMRGRDRQVATPPTPSALVEAPDASYNATV